MHIQFNKSNNLVCDLNFNQLIVFLRFRFLSFTLPLKSERMSLGWFICITVYSIYLQDMRSSAFADCLARSRRYKIRQFLTRLKNNEEPFVKFIKIKKYFHDFASKHNFLSPQKPKPIYITSLFIYILKLYAYQQYVQYQIKIILKNNMKMITFYNFQWLSPHMTA